MPLRWVPFRDIFIIDDSWMQPGAIPYWASWQDLVWDPGRHWVWFVVSWGSGYSDGFMESHAANYTWGFIYSKHYVSLHIDPSTSSLRMFSLQWGWHLWLLSILYPFLELKYSAYQDKTVLMSYSILYKTGFSQTVLFHERLHFMRTFWLHSEAER